MGKIPIKNKIKNLKPSSTLAINEKSKDLIKNGKKIYRFGFGQSPFPVPEKIVECLKLNASKKDYLPVKGLLDLREAISRYLLKRTGNDYPAENILITPGSKEAMYLMHLAFKGNILLPESSWVSYNPQAKIAENKVYWIQTSRDENWFPTTSQIKKIIKKSKSKNNILIINSPNNPSGTKCNNLRELADVAKKNNLIILSDEIYTELSFDKKYESISKYYPENTFISSGLSKWCGAGGWRIGFIAAPKKHKNFLESMKVLASETFSTVNTPTQFAAVEAYSGNYDDYLKSTINILNSVGQYVYRNLKSNNVILNKPQGGFYLMPEFLNTKFTNSAKLCESILKDTGVALLPGSDFGFNSKKMIVRLSYTDFDGSLFLRNIQKNTIIDDALILKYAPNVVEGVQKLSNWAKKF